MVGMGILSFVWSWSLSLGEVRVGVLVGIVRRGRRRGGYVKDKVEVFVRGVGRMMSVSCFFEAYVWEHTYSARSCYLQQGHELARSSTST